MAEIKTPDEFFLLLDDDEDASAESDAIHVRDRRLFTFAAFAESGSATAEIQVCLEATPVNWLPLTTVAKGAVKQVEGFFVWIRVVKSATSDPLSVQLLAGLRNVVH